MPRSSPLHRAALAASTLAALAAGSPAPALGQSWTRLELPDSAFHQAFAGNPAAYEAQWNTLFVTELRAGLAAADSAWRLLTLARRVARRETTLLGTTIGADALRLRSGWNAEARRRRIQAAVAESLAAAARAGQRPAEAESLYRAAIDLHRELGERRRAAILPGTIGAMWLAAGAYARAEAPYLEALAARRELGDPRLVGNALGDLGQTYFKLRRYPAAHAHLHEARALREATGQRDLLWKTFAYLGSTLAAMGRADSARRCFEEALALTEGRSDSAASTLQVLVNTTAFLVDQGDMARAFSTSRRALALAEFAEDGASYAAIEHTIGDGLRRAGHFTASVRHFQVAVDLGDRLEIPERSAESLSGLGQAWHQLGDPARARAALQRALALADSLGDATLRARSLINLSVTAEQEGDAAGAAELARRVLREAEARGDSEYVAAAARSLGYLAERDRRIAEAERWYARAIACGGAPSADERATDLVNHGNMLVVLGREREGEALLARALELSERGAYEEGVTSALCGLGEAAERRSDIATAHARYARALALIDSMRARQGEQRGAIKALAARRFVFDAMIHLLGRLDPLHPDSGFAERAFLWAERARARALLDLMAAGESRLSAPEPLPLAAAQRLLQRREALLEYSAGDSSTSLWVIRHDRWRHYRLPPRRALRVSIEALRQALASPATAGSERTRAAQHALYRLLVEPAEDLLRGAEHLVISPDGELARVPFEALLARAPGKGKPAYLVQRHSFSYTPSAAILAARRSAGSEAGPVVALGDPRFGLAGVEAGAGPPPGSLPPLPGSAQEVAALREAAVGRPVTTLLGAEATRARLLAAAGSGEPAILHLATHGDVNEAEPELSGLWLAAPADSAEPERLTAADVVGLELRAGQVTLSACETGLGRIERGEGAMSLSRAFLAAGARSVLVSLWKVDDRSTAELMSRFYGALLGRRASRAAALAEAQRALLRSPATASPHHWAAFVLVGDRGPLGEEPRAVQGK